MRKFVLLYIVLSVLAMCFSSCSANKFMVRKNHQPRVKVEANTPMPIVEMGFTQNNLSLNSDSLQIKTSAKSETPFVHSVKPKETIMDILVKSFFPKKKEIFDPILHPQKKKLHEAKQTADERVTGLVINLLALAFGIAAVLMVIGMAHGNVWVYFIIGMVFAAAAIIMGFIGKMLPWKAFGWLAGTIGILAVVLLLIFLLLITVAHITF